MKTCNCDLCRGLDAKRAAAIRWLGSRWLLAVPPKQVAADIIVDVDWSPAPREYLAAYGYFIAPPAKPRPQLRLVK